MGLDSVELVMSLEETFNVAIEDSDAERMLTPRHVVDYLMQKVGYIDRASCVSQRAFHRLRSALVRGHFAKRAEVRLESRMENWFPIESRKTGLEKLLAALEMKPKVRLEAGNRFSGLGILFVLGAGFGPFWFSFRASDWFWKEYWWLPSFGLVVAALLLLAKVRNQFAQHFPPQLETVGGFTRFIIAANPVWLRSVHGEWSRQAVEERVRQLVIEQLGLQPEKYRLDGRFIQDFGMD